MSTNDSYTAAELLSAEFEVRYIYSPALTSGVYHVAEQQRGGLWSALCNALVAHADLVNYNNPTREAVVTEAPPKGRRLCKNCLSLKNRLFTGGVF